MSEALLIGVLSAIMSSFITFFITTIAQRNSVKEMIDNHEKIWHQDSMYEYVESQLKSHSSVCPANAGLNRMTRMIEHLLALNGVDPSKID